MAFLRICCVRRCGCVGAVTSCSAGTPCVVGALIFGHAAPDAVSLGGGEGVGAAVGEHGAGLADLFGGALTLAPDRAAFAVGGEEDFGVGAAAGGVVLPVRVDAVVRMIRHYGISRFRSRAVKRFAGKSGHALVRMVGSRRTLTVCTVDRCGCVVGVASLKQRSRKPWYGNTSRTHHGSLRR